MEVSVTTVYNIGVRRGGVNQTTSGASACARLRTGSAATMQEAPLSP